MSFPYFQLKEETQKWSLRPRFCLFCIPKFIFAIYVRICKYKKHTYLPQSHTWEAHVGSSRMNTCIYAFECLCVRTLTHTTSILCTHKRVTSLQCISLSHSLYICLCVSVHTHKRTCTHTKHTVQTKACHFITLQIPFILILYTPRCVSARAYKHTHTHTQTKYAVRTKACHFITVPF